MRGSSNHETRTQTSALQKLPQGGGINIVAIQNHMPFENPRMVFLHYWGIGPIGQLACTLRAALDTQLLN